MSLRSVVEGSTAVIVHRLLENDEPFNLYGLNVSLRLEKRTGEVIDVTNKVSNLDDGSVANRGKVSFAPGANDWKANGSDYYWRWIVVDGAGHIVFWPDGEAERVRVYPRTT